MIIPGFGRPHSEEKIAWLRDRLELLAQQQKKYHHDTSLQFEYEVWLFVYDNTEIPDALYNHNPYNYTPQAEPNSSLNRNSNSRLKVVRHPGVLSEFLLQHCHPETIREQQFTHVVVTVDDMAWVNVDVVELKYYYDRFKLDIIQPAMAHGGLTSHTRMLVDTTLLETSPSIIGRIVNGMEWFCYFFDVDRYAVWYKMHDVENRWTWGIDLVLYPQLQMKLGILDIQQVNHMLTDDHSATTNDTAMKRWHSMHNWFTKNQYKHLDPAKPRDCGITLQLLTTNNPFRTCQSIK